MFTRVQLPSRLYTCLVGFFWMLRRHLALSSARQSSRENRMMLTWRASPAILRAGTQAEEQCEMRKEEAWGHRVGKLIG